MDNQLLTVKEVTSRLKISRTMLHSLTKDGKIKAVKIGPLVRYEESEVLAFIKESTEEPQSKD